MTRFLALVLLAAALVLGGSRAALAACSTNTDCNSANVPICVGGLNPAASTGITFSGMCAGGANATEDSSGNPCRLVRCSSNTPVIVSGPPSSQGCSSDAQCSSNGTSVCVSSAGAGACGTGFSQCVPVCFATTTSTSTSSTSTSSSSTSTSSTTSTT